MLEAFSCGLHLSPTSTAPDASEPRIHRLSWLAFGAHCQALKDPLPARSIASLAISVRNSDQFQPGWNARTDRFQLWKKLRLRNRSLHRTFEVGPSDLPHQTGPRLEVRLGFEHVQAFVESPRRVFKKLAERLALLRPG
jgi:hypothetical protein